MSGLLIDNISMRFDLPNGSHVQALAGCLSRHSKRRVDECSWALGLWQNHFAEYCGGLSGPDIGDDQLNDHVVTAPRQNAAWCFSRVLCSSG